MMWLVCSHTVFLLTTLRDWSSRLSILIGFFKFKYFKYNNFSTLLALICLLGEANGGAAGGVLPDVAVGAADHGLAAGAQAIPALDLNYVDSK